MRLLLELWPSLLPLLLCLLWVVARRRTAVRAGAPKPRLREGPWFWAILVSIATACALFILLGLSASGVKGNYVPPHMENGKVVRGEIKP